MTLPNDLSVVGVDDIRYAEVMDPPLTTVAQPADEIGEKAMYRLLRAIDDPADENGIDYIRHRPIISKSTMPPTGFAFSDSSRPELKSLGIVSDAAAPRRNEHG
ncbi:LacI family transcriptional regulator [Rhizobium sp. CCGE 510]|nr:LacI family transcriptional regulator [Rhizobium sp. CCGE 510]